MDWAEAEAIVDGVRRGDETAKAELYRMFRCGFRTYLKARSRPADVDERLHDAFIVVFLAIRNGELRDPQRLISFAWTVTRRQVAHACKRQRAWERACMHLGIWPGGGAVDAEQVVLRGERLAVMHARLARLSDDDRKILVRFYLHDQPWEQICKETGLTHKQFEVKKSRAKAKLAGRRR